MTTTGICLKTLPRMPGTKNRGRKATMLVRTLKFTGMAISLTPMIAAAAQLRPL